MKILTTILIAALSPAQFSQAQVAVIERVSGLKEACQTTRMFDDPSQEQYWTTKHEAQWSACTAFIDGYLLGARDRFCLPEGTTRQQRILIVLDWMERNPSSWHMHNSVAPEMAFSEVWPCN